MAISIESVLTGRAARLTGDGEMSAIAKSAVAGPRAIGLLGIEGDEQADLSVHGGPEKAIHHYPRDHYAWWGDRLPGQALLSEGGAFGENISTHGLTEQDVCIGDRFRLGTALVEICQGRQPCWKQAYRLGDKSVVAAMVKSGHSGWYYRVIEPGHVAAGDALVHVDRKHSAWTVARTTALVVGGVGRNGASLRDLRRVPELAMAWQARLDR